MQYKFCDVSNTIAEAVAGLSFKCSCDSNLVGHTFFKHLVTNSFRQVMTEWPNQQVCPVWNGQHLVAHFRQGTLWSNCNNWCPYQKLHLYAHWIVVLSFLLATFSIILEVDPPSWDQNNFVNLKLVQWMEIQWPFGCCWDSYTQDCTCTRNSAVEKASKFPWLFCLTLEVLLTAALD